MADLTAQKTLVKSPPELWTELSEVESLAKHLGELGEIRITRVEPESTVAWEGEDVCGTVELEQSGWGTKVTFRATVPEPGPAVDAEPEPDAVAAEPVAVEPEPVAVEPELVSTEPEPVAVEPDPDPEPVADPEPLVAEAAPAEPKRPGFFARWLFRQRAPRPEPAAVEPEPVAIAEPEPVAIEPEPASPEPEPEPVAVTAEPADPPADPEPPVATADVDRVQRVLDGTLEALGQAHHRPFSRG
jgi:hypothetical protein